MTLHSVRNVFRRRGLLGGCLHYMARFGVKIQILIIGNFAKYFCRIAENRIVFKCRHFLDYSDNARAFSDYLIQNGYNGKYQIIWLVSDKKRFRHIQIPNVKFFTAENQYTWSSPAACWYAATAKYFFYTHNTAALNHFHCKGQITINLWHGCGYKANTSDHISSDVYYFDYMLVPGPLFVPIKAKYWKCAEDFILPLGYPRFDWLLHSSNEQRTLLKKKFLNGTDYSKIVIWLPTFRKSGIDAFHEGEIELPFFLPGLKNASELDDIDFLCRESDFLLLIKRHPVQQEWGVSGRYTNIRFLSDRELENANTNLFSLLGICDALITDYSSAAVDFLLLNRPIGFVLADYEQYKEMRGFIFDDPLEYMPGEKLYSIKDIKAFLKQLSSGVDLWKGRREQLLPVMHNKSESYSQRIALYFKL